MTVQIRDSDGTVRLSGDLLATGGATGDVLTQQADGTYAPAASPAPTTPTLAEVLTAGGDPDGHFVTGPLIIDPTADANQLEIRAPNNWTKSNDLIKATGPFAGGAQDQKLVEFTGDGSFLLRSGDGSVGLNVQDETGTNSFNIGSSGASLTRSSSQVFKVLIGGGVSIAQHAAPSDGSLSAGEMVIWFDQTNGAPKLMVKAKQANGTVVTGSTALAP